MKCRNHTFICAIAYGIDYQKCIFSCYKRYREKFHTSKKRLVFEMRFSAILIALTASVFADKNLDLAKCLERANYDVGLSFDCFEKAIKKGRKSKDRFL